MHHHFLKSTIISMTVLLCTGITYSFSTSNIQNKKWAIFGGLGYINYLTNTVRQSFAVSNIETDALSQTSHGRSMGYTVGFAKDNYLQTSKLPIISIGMTLRYDPTNLQGQVYQFEDSSLNNYTYQFRARLVSTIAESNLFLPAIQKWHMSPFIITGFGLAFGNVSYTETAEPNIPANTAYRASTWVTRPDLVLGAGLQWDIKKYYFIQAQYLYQYRGTAHLPISAFVQGVPIKLDQQSADILAGYQFS